MAPWNYPLQLALLPILDYRRLNEVIETIRSGEKPLAMYFFSASRSTAEKLLSATSAGGGCVNDTIMHLLNPRLPFGGAGSSGMGSYHGKFSFDTFSHHRSILRKTTLFNPPMAYPPPTAPRAGTSGACSPSPGRGCKGEFKKKP